MMATVECARAAHYVIHFFYRFISSGSKEIMHTCIK